jgi:cellulose biosynthesis protein BcsQ
MRTMVITNQKGGCGKTTTSLNLAAALAQLGQRVLLIDLDPQAHATLGLGYEPENLENTIYNVISNRRFHISKAILDTKVEGLDLIPSNIRLSKVEHELNLVTQKEFILADQLKKISDKYDICVVDCPPSLGLLTSNALVASTDIIVPVQVHYYALEGLKQLLETIKLVRKRFYPCSIRILGLLLTFVEDKASLSRQVEQQMKNFFGDLVFKTVIHRTISLAEAPSAGETILTYAPESKGASEYKALAQEVLESETKDKTKEPQKIEQIVEQLKDADKQISIKHPDKSKKQARVISPIQKLIITSEPKPEEETKEKETETEKYHIPRKKSNTGRLLLMLFLLVSAVVVAVITFVNNPPSAQPGEISIPEDTPTEIVLTGTDKDRDELKYNIINNPEHGLLSGTAPKLTYTPDKDYTGPDSLTFTVSDGKVDSNAVTVSIVVTPVNDPPVADPQKASIKVNRSLPITLTGNDSDSEKITFAIYTEPVNGSISSVPGFESSGKIIYTPKADYIGPDRFTFVTNDGESNSKPAAVLINVTRNNPPVVNLESISTVEDIPVTIMLKGEDPDGDTLDYRIAAAPLHGTLSGEAPNLTYTPNENYGGPDSFTYLANDGIDDSFAATVTITVKSINDAPIAKPGSLTTQEDTPMPVTLVATDPDGDALTYEIVTAPSHGKLTQTAPNMIYIPVSNYNGTDSFSFRASDGTSQSAIADFSITIQPMEDAPIAVTESSVSLNEDSPKTITLEASDPDGDPLTYNIERAPSYGTLSGKGPQVVYTPKKDFNFLDSFTFSVSDGKNKSNTATVYITVNSVNDPPVANDDKAETFEDEPIESIRVIANDTDLDKDPLTIKEVTQAPHGKVEINPDNTLRYTPEPNYYGIDSFTYTAQDPDGQTGTARVEVRITPLNDKPRIVSEPVTTAMQGVLYIYDVNAIDPDGGDKLSYSLISKPAGMTIDEKTGVIEWIPDDVLAAPNDITVSVTDNSDIAASATQTFSIKVVPAPPKIATLSITRAFDRLGKSIFSEAKDVNTVLSSDNNYLEIKHGSHITFDFSDVSVPSGATITSFVLYVEHYEQDSFVSGKAKWSIGQNWPDSPQVWFTIDAPLREGQRNDSMDSWDIASFVATPEKMNNFQFQIANNDMSRSIFVDYLYVIAQWDWPESPGLVEYILKPVKK